MTPTQVTIRFPAEAGRPWQFRPTGAPPQAGAILPRPWDVTPDAAEAADGTFEVALLATDQATTRWAWQVRDSHGRRGIVAVPAHLAGQVIDYADLPDEDLTGTTPTVEAPTGVAGTTAPTAGISDLEQAPSWILSALRDMARRIAYLEARDGATPGDIPIDATNPDAYLAGFINDVVTDYL